MQVGGALGVAVVGLVFYRFLGPTLDYAHAFRAAIAVLVVVALAVAATVQLLPRGAQAEPGSGGAEHPHRILGRGRAWTTRRRGQPEFDNGAAAVA